MNDIAMYIGYTIMVISSLAVIVWAVLAVTEKLIIAMGGMKLFFQFVQQQRDNKKDEL